MLRSIPRQRGFRSAQIRNSIPLRAFWNIPCVFCLNDGGAVCPEPDIDPVELGRRIKALEKQLKLLDKRLLRAELQLKEMETEREGGWKKFSDP